MRYRIVVATDTRAQPVSPESKTSDYYAHPTSWDNNIFRAILEMVWLHFPKFHHAVSEDKKGIPLCLVKRRSLAVGSHT